MSIKDCVLVFKRSWKLLVVFAILGACLAGAYDLSAKREVKYVATAYIYVNSQINGVTGVVESEKARYVSDVDPSVSVSVKTDTSSYRIAVFATASDADVSMKAANEIVASANELATSLFSEYEKPYSGITVLAENATKSNNPGINLKLIGLGLIGGLFIAMALSIVMVMRKHRIISPATLRLITDLPILGVFSTESVPRLLAALFFVGGRDNKGVFLLPLDEGDSAVKVRDALISASSGEEVRDRFSITVAPPLDESTDVLFKSQDNAVVLIVRQWKDSLNQLASALSELRIADAEVKGIIFIPDKKRSK